MKKTNITTPLKQITALVLFFATSFGVATYSLGFFAPSNAAKENAVTLAPLVPVRTTAQTTTDEPEETTVPTTTVGEVPNDSPQQTIYLTNLAKANTTSMIEGFLADRATVSLSARLAAYNKLTASIESNADGSPVTYESYTADGYKLVRGVRLEGDFTDGEEVIVRYSKVYSAEDGSYQTMATEYTVDRKKVQPYMGYLLFSHVETREVVIKPPEPEVPEVPETPETTLPEDAQTPEGGDAPVTEAPSEEIVPEETLPEETLPEETAPEETEPEPIEPQEPQIVIKDVTVLTLCDAKGNVIIEDIGDKYPYYARDNKNRPVFVDDDGKFYAFDGKKFIEIKESALRIWLFYDYPAYPLGAYRNYESVYDPETGLYRYVNYKTGSTSVTTDYFKAFNFSENGYAVVVSSLEDNLYVINRSKRIQFNAGGRYKFPTGDTGHSLSAKNAFRLPDTLGIESIGSTGYDHGWLRIRVQALSQMSNSLGTIISDWEALVDEKGNYFEIPEGYALEGYSDGVLLLSKDGLYGYYSIEGKWITQPIFTYARPFIQGLAVVGSETGTVGMIDTSGNIVLPFVYTSLSDVSSGVITAYCEGIGWETYYLLKNN